MSDKAETGFRNISSNSLVLAGSGRVWEIDLLVGKSMGRPPEDRTPRLTESIRRGMLEWQGLKEEEVLIMPMLVGCESAR